MIKKNFSSHLPESVRCEFNRLVQSLINHLLEQIRLYDELYQLIKFERQLIKQPDIEAFSLNHSKKEAFFLQAQICGENTQEDLKALQKILGPGCLGEVTITLISGYAENDLRKQLLECREKLYFMIKAVRGFNAGNKDLLRSTVSFTRSTLLFLQQLSFAPINYTPTGQFPAAMPNGQILNKKG